MKTFILKILSISLPFAIFTLPIAILLKSYGEAFVDFDSLISKQDFKLIGQKYSESNTLWFKSKLAEKKKAKVLALGSSRVLQFRAEMFSESFFNYGYTTTKNYTLLPTLRLIPDESLPEVLILGLDQWNFNKIWDESSYPVHTNILPRIRNTPSPMDIFSFLIEVFENGLNLKNTEGLIGLNAIIYGNGFRQDGSRDYGDLVDKILEGDSTYNDYKFRNTLERIRLGNSRFEWGESIDKSQLNYVRDLISYCNKKHIKLILFLPPFAPKVWHEMERSNRYKYISNLSEELSKMCVELDVLFLDFTSPLEISYGDNEMVDGFHGGEKVYSKILLRIAKEDRLVKNYINVKGLEKRVLIENELSIFDDHAM